MPIFCVKSVKIYTGQKKFTRTYSWRSWQISGMYTATIKSHANDDSWFTHNIWSLEHLVTSKILDISANIILWSGWIWNFQTPRLLSFEIFLWCLKAKFEISPLRRRMFVINTTIWVVFEPNTTAKTWCWVRHHVFSKHHRF